MKAVLILLAFAVFGNTAVDSISVYSSFGFLSNRDSEDDENIGVRLVFNKSFYTDHCIIHDRYEMINQIASIGVQTPNFRFGFMMGVKYKSDYYRPGVKLYPALIYFGAYRTPRILS